MAQPGACEKCGTGLPAGVTGLCDRCMLGIAEPADGKSEGIATGPLVNAYKGPSGRVERRRRPRHVRQAPVGTWLMMTAILACFAAIRTYGGADDYLTLLRWGAKANDKIWRGELWRFVTPMFVHTRPWHMACNLAILFLFGPQLEVLVGTARFLIVYLVSGVCGVIAGFCFHDYLSAGASGAIFGIFGAILAFLVTNRTSFRHLRSKDVALYGLWMILLLALQSVQVGVDNWAHFGGLVGGFLTGLMLVPRLPGLVPRPKLRWLGGVMLVGLAAAGIARGQQWMTYWTEGQYALIQNNIPAAREAFQKCITLRRRAIPALIALAKLEAREGRLPAAIEAMERLRDLEPDNPDVHYHLAELYRDMGRAKDALIELEAIHTFDPTRLFVYPALGRAYLDNGDARKAVEILGELPAMAFDEDPTSQYYLGDALRRTGQIEKGERQLRAYEERLRTLAATDQTARSHNNLAWFLFEEGRSLDEALQMAAKAVEKDPTSQYYLGTLGCVYYQLGRYKDALTQLEKALERHISKADAGTDLYFASMTAMKLGQPDIARKYLKLAEEADPRNRYLALARRTVETPASATPSLAPSPKPSHPAAPSPAPVPSPR